MELEKNSNGKSKRRCFNQPSHLFYSEEAEHMLARDIAAGANRSVTGRVQCTNVSDLKLSEESLSCLSSSLDADLEIYNKQRMRVDCAQIDENKEEAGMRGRACDDTHCSCRLCDDCRQSYLGEDSQLEYLSAHEQDFDDWNSSREFSEQRVTAGIKTLKLVDPGPEVPGVGVTQEQNVVDMLEDCSASEYGKTCPEAAMAELPHLLQDCLSLLDYSGMACDHEEEQTEYHNVICGSVLESHSYGNKERASPNLLVCDSLGNGEVKDIPLTDGMLPPHIATGEEASEKNDRHVHSISVKQDNPLPFPRQRSSAVATLFCSCAGDFDFCSGEEPSVCVRAASCIDHTTKDAETPFPVSEILTSTNPCFAEKSSHGNTSCLNSDCHETLEKITSVSTVNQAVDASSDFRACFTTSRSTSAEVCLSSRAMNTEITMMSKSRPTGWHRETCADVACNTDWSCGASSTGEIQSQLTDTLEKPSGGNTATTGRSSQIQEQQGSENKLYSSDLKTNTDRLVDLDKQAVKNSASSYCQKLLQRAIEAELQVLDAHYQMCCQHCLKSYNLALERSICFSRCKGNTELRSSVMSVLKELKKNYSSRRMQIKGGVPLNALPPLSVEMLFPISSYVPCKLFRGDLCSDSFSGKRTADFEAPTQPQKRIISVDMDNPQTLCLTGGGQPSDSHSSKTFEEQDKDQDMECGFMKNEENEGWSDAKEDLTDANFSVISEETKKQPEKQDTVDLRAKQTESGNECSFIRGGGLSSSVSEGDLRSHFQKNQISDTLISLDSSNYRYTRLSCNDSNKAKLAVEEMNQKTMKGNPVSVEVVNTSPENKYVVSQVLTNERRCEIQPVDNGQRSDQDKPLTSASSSVQAPDATAASEKTHLLPVTTSTSSCSTQAPSETKHPGLKSSTDISDTGENLQKKTSATLSTKSYDTFISPNILNLSSFAKLMKKLQEIHPETSRDKIVDALLEVRKNNSGILCGLSIRAIVESASKILQKSTPGCGWEKQCK